MKLILKTNRAKRTARAKETWLRVATDVLAGMAAEDIAKRYTNPLTGKTYSTQWVYWVVNKINNDELLKGGE